MQATARAGISVVKNYLEPSKRLYKEAAATRLSQLLGYPISAASLSKLHQRGKCPAFGKNDADGLLYWSESTLRDYARWRKLVMSGIAISCVPDFTAPSEFY